MENNNDNIIMSRLAFERMQSKDEQNDHWRNVALIWACIIILVLIILLVGSNAMWLYAWNQYDYVDEEISVEASQDGDGINIAGAGDISYGTNGEGNEKDTNKET